MSGTGLTSTMDRGKWEEGLTDSQGFYRIHRTSIADYDDTGTSMATGGGGAPTGGGGATILDIAPNSATEGESVTVNITLDGMLPPANVTPSSVLMNDVSATAISYNGTTVTATFMLPLGSTGLRDLSITFPPPPGGANALVITQTGGFTVKSVGL